MFCWRLQVVSAKVIANYSNKPAFTIHKKIYFPKKSSGGGFTLQQNKHKNTIFIVDEASMISDTNSDSNYTKTVLCSMI
jgi:ATP-dependent exoDNAse (exonuclease V) alpha subunit